MNSRGKKEGFAELFNNLLAAYPDTASFIGMFVVPLVILIALVIIPPRQRRKKQETLIANLKPKDKVVTYAGIIGTVEKIDKDKIILRVDEKTRIPFLKDSIARMLKDQE